MEFTEQDRTALYNVWMSQKAKMHMTQMEMTRRLGLKHHEFSSYLRGDTPLTLGFINQLCEQLNIQPSKVIPSLARRDLSTCQAIILQNRITVDGVVRHVFVEGNQVIIEYEHAVN